MFCSPFLVRSVFEIFYSVLGKGKKYIARVHLPKLRKSINGDVKTTAEAENIGDWILVLITVVVIRRLRSQSIINNSTASSLKKNTRWGSSKTLYMPFTSPLNRTDEENGPSKNRREAHKHTQLGRLLRRRLHYVLFTIKNGHAHFYIKVKKKNLF